jgi:hypothetical protein
VLWNAAALQAQNPKTRNAVSAFPVQPSEEGSAGLPGSKFYAYSDSAADTVADINFVLLLIGLARLCGDWPVWLKRGNENAGKRLPVLNAGNG